MRHKEKVLVIPDLQIPFEHKDALRFLIWAKERYAPTKVVCIGDITDSYCLSNYVRDPDALGATEEIGLMLKKIKQVAEIFPELDLLISNHDRRIYRAAHRAGIPSHFIKDYHDWMGCPKTWKFHQELMIEDILYTHGDESGAGGQQASLKRAMAYGRSTVSGHLHTMSEIRYFANKDKLIFGMQVGCLIDKDAVAFNYARVSLKKPVLTIGLIDKGIPMLIPMLLKKNGRWNSATQKAN